MAQTSMEREARRNSCSPPIIAGFLQTAMTISCACGGVNAEVYLKVVMNRHPFGKLGRYMRKMTLKMNEHTMMKRWTV